MSGLILNTNEVLAKLPHAEGSEGQGHLAAALAANTDAQAVSAWLVARGQRSSHTFDSYKREANRLLMWMAENELTLHALKVEHASVYYEHLRFPPARWLRPRKLRAGQRLAATQVMAAGASEKGIDYARRVLSQLCGYLQDAGYIQRNVFRLSARPVIVVTSVSSRNLDISGWQWLWDWVCEMPRRTAVERRVAIRTRWLFALLYHTGLRREEVAKGLMSDFVRTDGKWTLKVIGKGAKERFVTINSVLQDELANYRTAMGISSPWPSPEEDYPLLLPYSLKRRTSNLTPRAIGGMVASIAEDAASACDDLHIRARIIQLSTHWLRHTNATHRLEAGASLLTTQDELGHADPKTTRIYAQTSSKARQEDAERLGALVTSKKGSA